MRIGLSSAGVSESDSLQEEMSALAEASNAAVEEELLEDIVIVERRIKRFILYILRVWNHLAVTLFLDKLNFSTRESSKANLWSNLPHR